MTSNNGGSGKKENHAVSFVADEDEDREPDSSASLSTSVASSSSSDNDNSSQSNDHEDTPLASRYETAQGRRTASTTGRRKIQINIGRQIRKELIDSCVVMEEMNQSFQLSVRHGSGDIHVGGFVPSTSTTTDSSKSLSGRASLSEVKVEVNPEDGLDKDGVDDESKKSSLMTAAIRSPLVAAVRWMSPRTGARDVESAIWITAWCSDGPFRLPVYPTPPPPPPQQQPETEQEGAHVPWHLHPAGSREGLMFPRSCGLSVLLVEGAKASAPLPIQLGGCAQQQHDATRSNPADLDDASTTLSAQPPSRLCSITLPERVFEIVVSDPPVRAAPTLQQFAVATVPCWERLCLLELHRATPPRSLKRHRQDHYEEETHRHRGAIGDAARDSDSRSAAPSSTSSCKWKTAVNVIELGEGRIPLSVTVQSGVVGIAPGGALSTLLFVSTVHDGIAVYRVLPLLLPECYEASMLADGAVTLGLQPFMMLGPFHMESRPWIALRLACVASIPNDRTEYDRLRKGVAFSSLQLVFHMHTGSPQRRAGSLLIASPVATTMNIRLGIAENTITMMDTVELEAGGRVALTWGFTAAQFGGPFRFVSGRHHFSQDSQPSSGVSEVSEGPWSGTLFTPRASTLIVLPSPPPPCDDDDNLKKGKASSVFSLHVIVAITASRTARLLMGLREDRRRGLDPLTHHLDMQEVASSDIATSIANDDEDVEGPNKIETRSQKKKTKRRRAVWFPLDMQVSGSVVNASEEGWMDIAVHCDILGGDGIWSVLEWSVRMARPC